jgi:hypothetical protein
VCLLVSPNKRALLLKSDLPRPKLSLGLFYPWFSREMISITNVTGFLAMSNVTEKPIDVNVQITDNAGRNLSSLNLTVTPHGTKTVNLTELLTATTSAEGVLLTHDGPEGGLVVNGGLEDEAVGYSAHLPIMSLKRSAAPAGSTVANSAEIQKSSYAELGLMTGAADPLMNFPAETVFAPYTALRNVAEQPFTVTPTLWWMEGGTAHSALLPQVTVLPHQTRTVDLPALIAGAGLKNFNGSVSLELDTQGPKGGLLMTGGSVDRRNTYVFEVTPRAILESVAKHLAYWSTGNGDDTMVTVWNPADEAQEFNFTLFFSGGHYAYPIHLGPRAAQTFNVSEIVHNEIPDAEGNIVPASVHEGRAKIAGAQGDSEHILVTMDAGTYNVKKATCFTGCTTFDGVANSFVNADPFALGVGGTMQETFIEQYGSGNQYDATSLSSWSSSDTSIATVNSGLVSGGGVGSFSITAFDATQEPGYDVVCGWTGVVECPFSYVSPSGSGSGTVQVPTSLKFISVSVLPDGSSGAFGCAPNADYGIRVDIKYQVMDQNTPATPIQSAFMVPHEKGTLFDGTAFDNDIGPVASYPTSSRTTAQDGTFHDVPFGYCQNTPIDAARAASQNITIILNVTSYPVRSQTWSVSAPGSSSFGHGTISNTISPGNGSDVSATR